MKNKVKILTLLGMGFCFGLAAVITNYTASKTQRDPAAAGESLMQISNLTYSEIRTEILNRMKVRPTVKGKKVIELNGISTSLCKEVKSIELIFAAEGVSVAGEPPKMTVSVPCEQSYESAEIDDVKIPVGLMMEQRFQNTSYQIQGYNSVIIQNSADDWPTTWVLSQIDIYTNTDIKHINIDHGFSEENLQHPVVLEF